ncbi:MAG: DivIVA domain-containing protein [candidate division Zixibacteria bacterium]|nr:DivIVA domain-containing protein [candidate division Zixibacteria bacterium]MDH3937849.1 DivIVA domain-containing protein [candidate division Zixibacteria bacterium]MDH4032308.1 DivIVA domain-containing protein [candidate division Zixibacteria bacterium]
MDLSPNDIRNCEFSTQMRGYSKEEVDSLLDQVAAALDAVKQENLKLSMEVDSLKSQLAGLRQFEDTIKSAAIDARRNADMTVANAKQEADLILSKAKDEADRVLSSRTEQLGALDSKIAAAEMAKKSYLNKVHGVITSHLEIIEHLVKAEPDIKTTDQDQDHDHDSDVDNDSGKIEVTESGEVDRKQMETIGTPSESDESIRTEEANAAEEIVEVSTEADSDAAESGDNDAETAEAEAPKPIDPELAEALQKYQTNDSSSEQEPNESHAAEEPAPKPGEIVETSARAEDIPPGFIVGPSSGPSESSADKDSATDRFSVPNSSDPEQKSDAPSAGPEDLAKELDKVVAKFEEEMDRAAQS